MTNSSKTPSTRLSKPKRTNKKPTREERLAAALRTNLRRRKAPRATPDDSKEAADGTEDAGVEDNAEDTAENGHQIPPIKP
jgi:hypothetical protein